MKNLEDIITENRDEFNDKEPQSNHEERFLWKLKTKIKRFISIVPYLIKVLIVTILVFIGSIILWNNYIRKDRHEITLKEKVTNIINKVK
jgi:hypothetical protein